MSLHPPPRVRGADLDLGHFIEAWIDQTSSSTSVNADGGIDADGNPDLNSAHPFSPSKIAIGVRPAVDGYHDHDNNDRDTNLKRCARKRRQSAMNSPIARTSAVKRTRRESTDNELELTPRPSRQQADSAGSQPPSLEADDTQSEPTPSLSGASDISGASTTSRRSRYNSPTKRIRALQEATQLRLQTRDLTHQALQGLPQDIRDLVADLKEFQDRIGIIPTALKVRAHSINTDLSPAIHSLGLKLSWEADADWTRCRTLSVPRPIC